MHEGDVLFSLLQQPAKLGKGTCRLLCMPRLFLATLDQNKEHEPETIIYKGDFPHRKTNSGRRY